MGEPDFRPLRILLVTNVEWNPHFGAVRIYMELAEQWKSLGHCVEHFSLSEAFPVKASSARHVMLRRMLFPLKAAAFIRRNRKRFDVVDALIGAISRSKRGLGFSGLLVARSVGWYQSYDKFERTARQRWPERRGSFLGKLFYSLTNWWQMRACDSAVRHADLINFPNQQEATEFQAGHGNRHYFVQPYGLTAAYRQSLLQCALGAAERLAQQRICFIGMWGRRKGAADWGSIINRVRGQIPNACFRFLGTMVRAEEVFSDLKLDSREGVEVITEFSPAELPRLLSDCSAGALPSYVEGFGLAILEQLAAGIPTVAFDVGGPHDILSPHLPNLLVANGDVDRFADVLIRILQSGSNAYQDLVRASEATANEFSWTRIAEETSVCYQSALQQLGRAG